MKIQTSIIISAILVVTSFIGYQELEKYRAHKEKERLENCNNKYSEYDKLAYKEFSEAKEGKQNKETSEKLKIEYKYLEKYCPEVVKVINKLEKEAREEIPLVLKELDRKEKELESIFKRNKIAYKKN